MTGWIHLDLGPSAMVPLLLGAFTVFFGLISMVIKEWLFVSETLVAFLFGIGIGPVGINAINPVDWFDVTKFTFEFSRFIIAVQVMAAGITLPKKYLLVEFKSLLMLLGPVMTCMWFISAIVIMLVFRLSLLESLLIASCVAPTDPVLANSIVKGKFAEAKVPQHIRNMISAESGANDGLGYPYLYLAIYLLKFSTREAISRWVLVVVMWEIMISIFMGWLIGWAARKLLRYARERNWMDHDSFLSFAISLTLLTLGIVSFVGSDDILACFVAGNVLTWDDWFREETQEANFQDVLDSLFNYTFFIYLGTIIPWDTFTGSIEMITPGRLISSAALIILFRRLPATMAVTRLTPAIETFREALFAGWFGPIGVGAMFYAMVGYEELKDSAFDGMRVKECLLPIVFSLVIASVIIHGITIPLYHIATAIPQATTAVTGFWSRPQSRSSGDLFTIRTNNAVFRTSQGIAPLLFKRPDNARTGAVNEPFSNSCPSDPIHTITMRNDSSDTIEVTRSNARGPDNTPNYGSILVTQKPLSNT